MGLALPGLATGMDTSSLISSLMRIEAIPQTMLKSKLSASQGIVASLQTLNSRIASLADVGKALAAPDALGLFTAASSSPTVQAKVGTGASAGSLEFVVDRVARTHTGVTAPMAAWPSDPPVLTLVAADGTRTEVTAASTALDDVVAAVNSSAAGVTALKVATGDGSYRLQLTAGESGQAGTFTAYRGSSADIDAGTAVDLFAEQGAAVTAVGQDAQVTLWAGTGAAQAITSSTNTFTGLLPGVDVTVADVSAAPVTVTVARDTEQISQKAEDLVAAISGVLNYVRANSAVSAGGSATRAGVFSGDSAVRSANQRILSAAAMPVAGRSPSEIGMGITRDGTIEFDADKFAAAFAADPAFVESALTEIASRVEAAATVASDKYTGTVTSRIRGEESLVKSLNDRILEWDDRLSARQATLERIYSDLEVRISAMNAQSAWLSAQLATLPQAKAQP